MATGRIGSDICDIQTRTRKFSPNPNPIRTRLDLKNKTRTRSNGFRIGFGFYPTPNTEREQRKWEDAVDNFRAADPSGGVGDRVRLRERRAVHELRPGATHGEAGTPAWSPELVTRRLWYEVS